jgi:protein-tyrosine phosphatase
MIDFHSHILPNIDDGSRSVEETLLLLEMLSQQGIQHVAATPHYFPSRESVYDFLGRREKSFSELQQAAENKNLPKIHVGAEVSYYEGISKLKDIPLLCLADSNLLLVEMPMAKWSDYAIHEIMELACLPKTKLVLAHVERYRSYQNEQVWQQLLENDILMQVNASYFLQFGTKRKALSQLQKNEIHFLGSDCHDLKVRPPKIGLAYQVVSQKFGNEFLSSWLEFCNSFFNHPI